MGNSNSEFRKTMQNAGEKVDEFAKKASEQLAEGAKKAGKALLKTGKQIGESFCYQKINDVISDPMIRYNFIQTLKNMQIDPSSITIREYNSLTGTISFSISHVTSQYGRISSIPDYYTYYLKNNKIVNEYILSHAAQEEDEGNLIH